MAQPQALFGKHKYPVWLQPDDVTTLDTIEVPLLGFITAGKPIERIEIADEMVSVPSNMVKKESYALRVRGHSMIDDNIEDGDIIIIEQKVTASDGQSVVCLINNHEVTLKKFYIENGGVRLQPANPDMKPIYLKKEEIQILGIVSGIIRHFE